MADRSRSRSPQRDDDNNAPAAHDDPHGNGAPSHDNGGADGGVAGGDGGEEVKLYVGNLDYGEYDTTYNSNLKLLLLFENFENLKMKACIVI